MILRKKYKKAHTDFVDNSLRWCVVLEYINGSRIQTPLTRDEPVADIVASAIHEAVCADDWTKVGALLDTPTEV